MRIEDLVILGRSSPDRMKDGRLSVCTAGYSPTHGFVRLYPTKMDSHLSAWSIVSVPVEKNPQDARRESWKIEGSRHEWDNLGDKIEVKGSVRRKDRLRFVSGHVSDCVFDIRDQRFSLGLVRPFEKQCYFEKRKDYDPDFQTTLFGGISSAGKRDYELRPRVRFRCSSCRAKDGHDQQILEWGVYEWMRKNPGKEDQVWENLFSHESSQEVLFLVGNQATKPESFLVISILRIPKTTRGPSPRSPSISSSKR